MLGEAHDLDALELAPTRRAEHGHARGEPDYQSELARPGRSYQTVPAGFVRHHQHNSGGPPEVQGFLSGATVLTAKKIYNILKKLGLVDKGVKGLLQVIEMLKGTAEGDQRNQQRRHHHCGQRSAGHRQQRHWSTVPEQQHHPEHLPSLHLRSDRARKLADRQYICARGCRQQSDCDIGVASSSVASLTRISPSRKCWRVRGEKSLCSLAWPSPA